jgi:hypothetical protein
MVCHGAVLGGVYIYIGYILFETSLVWELEEAGWLKEFPSIKWAMVYFPALIVGTTLWPIFSPIVIWSWIRRR